MALAVQFTILVIAGLAVLVTGVIFGYKALNTETPSDGAIILAATFFTASLLTGIGMILLQKEAATDKPETLSLAITGTGMVGLTSVVIATLFLFLNSKEKQ